MINQIKEYMYNIPQQVFDVWLVEYYVFLIIWLNCFTGVI